MVNIYKSYVSTQLELLLVSRAGAFCIAPVVTLSANAIRLNATGAAVADSIINAITAFLVSFGPNLRRVFRFIFCVCHYRWLVCRHTSTLRAITIWCPT